MPGLSDGFVIASMLAKKHCFVLKSYRLCNQLTGENVEQNIGKFRT
jgi:hypothetical protein